MSATAPAPAPAPAGTLFKLRDQPFLATFLGGPVVSLLVDLAARPADLWHGLADLMARQRAAGVRLVDCRLPEARADLAAVLERAGFRRIELLVTLERPVAPAPEAMPGVAVSPAREADIARCVEIGRNAFRTDRFHADPEIPTAVADALKAQWVENGLRGRADAPLVARRDGGAQGFNLCMLSGDIAVIDLIAVAPEAQGRGIGRALVAGALRHYAGRARLMRVGTQEGNGASMALYRHCGFAPLSRQITLHWTP